MRTWLHKLHDYIAEYHPILDEELCGMIMPEVFKRLNKETRLSLPAGIGLQEGAKMFLGALRERDNDMP